MIKKVVVVGICFFLWMCGSAWAHHPTGGAGLGQAGPIRTIPASTFQKGKLGMALQSEFINFDAFSDNELRGYAESGNDVHSVDSVFHTVLAVGYGISDDFSLSLKISYESLNGIREVHHDEPDEIHNRGDSKGIGDLTIFGQYRFVKVVRDDFESTLLFGLKLPTGKTSNRDRGGEHVLFLSPGTRVTINKQWSAYLSVGFPVFQDLNGIQNKTTSRTVFGISASF